ncbi:putative protein N(5)-glutamine methyltransferase [Naasia lichenicola]|uniref:peptide chain release factor N(5)-glutamine methyltransferase n=1 Tax=Naasia lichenicola TaxID=2565933 RepID=A0A4V3WT17_9MICO|nr:putative protein N(5)-glutamine methyltransferase [Naasia lichenicola]
MVERLRAAGCVFAEDEAALLTDAATDSDDLERMILSRVAGLPLEQIVGWAEFGGLRILVDPGVFVPRRRTEILANEALTWTRSGSVVLDLCCGTGAVGAVLAARVPGIELYASELDAPAVENARRNLEPIGGSVFAGDLFGALPGSLRGRIDVLVVNAPYVPTAAIALMPPEARDWEPSVALDGGADGLDVHRRVAAEAAGWLAETGILLIETSRLQAPTTAQIFETRGFDTRIVHDDEIDGTAVLVTRGRAADEE